MIRALSLENYINFFAASMLPIIMYYSTTFCAVNLFYITQSIGHLCSSNVNFNSLFSNTSNITLFLRCAIPMTVNFPNFYTSAVN